MTGQVLKLKPGTVCSPFQSSVELEDGSEFKENKLKGGINARRHGDEVQKGIDYNESIKVGKSAFVDILIKDETLPKLEGDEGTNILLGRHVIYTMLPEYNRQASSTSIGQEKIEYQHFVGTTKGDIPEAAAQWKQIIGKYCNT